MSLLPTITLIAIGLSFAMGLAWLVAERSGNHGWVDTIWSFSTGIAAVAGALLPASEGWLPRQIVVALLIGLWSARLGTHLVQRTLKAKDDPRYAQLRKDWGASASRRLFTFLQIQALAALVLVLAVMAAAHHPGPSWHWGDVLGVTIALVAVAGEAVADHQLARFRADPANRSKVCDAGLWGLTRHPNYFFEWLGWLAYPAIALDVTGGHLWGITALAAPLLIYVLLVHASGIPPTEAHMLRTRGDAYRAYQRRVNAFWPGLPKRNGSQ